LPVAVANRSACCSQAGCGSRNAVYGISTTHGEPLLRYTLATHSAAGGTVVQRRCCRRDARVTATATNHRAPVTVVLALLTALVRMACRLWVAPRWQRVPRVVRGGGGGNRGGVGSVQCVPVAAGGWQVKAARNRGWVVPGAAAGTVGRQRVKTYTAQAGWSVQCHPPCQTMEGY